MEFITKNILWIILAIIVIFLAYKYFTKDKTETSSAEPKTISSIFLPKSSSPQPDLTKTDTPVSVVQINNMDISGFKVGDKMYAKTGLNAYKTGTSTSASNLYKYFSADNYIGTYLGKDGSNLKILSSSTGLLNGIVQTINTPVYVYIGANNTKVYKK